MKSSTSFIIILIKNTKLNLLTTGFLHAKESFCRQLPIVKISKRLGTTRRPFVFVSGVIHNAVDTSTRTSLPICTIWVVKIMFHPKSMSNFMGNGSCSVTASSPFADRGFIRVI